MSETQVKYTVEKMEIAKLTVIDGRVNRLKFLKAEIERRSTYLVEEAQKGRMDWVKNEASRIHELASEAYIIERDLKELNQMFAYLEGKDEK